MADLIDNIKEIAHTVAEDYLLLGKDMNESIIEYYDKGEIENDEVLKRITEMANQNVYLSLFNDKTTDKSNIKFDLADYDKIKTLTEKRENAMQDYNSSPLDFRLVIDNDEPVVAVANDSSDVKTAALHQCLSIKTTYENFRNSIEAMKNSEIRDIETYFNKMARDAKVMVAGGDSIGDIAKIASRSCDGEPQMMMKIAQAYDIIHKELIKSGFAVKTEFTKVSSYAVNEKSDLVKTAKEYALSLEKIAGFDEMIQNLNKKISQFDNLISKSIKK